MKTLWEFFEIHSVGKYQKHEGGPFGEFFFRKKSQRAENTVREYPLAPLSSLDDVKILLRELSKNCNNCKNCTKSGPFRVRLWPEKKTTHCNSRASFLKGKSGD